MYELIIRNNMPNSPIKEFGTDTSYFQIVLQDNNSYESILNLIAADKDIIDGVTGNTPLALSDTARIMKTMEILLANGYVNRETMDSVLNVIIPGYATAAVIEPSPTPNLAEDEHEEIFDFFNEYLEKKIGIINLERYRYEVDGGLNPALKIFGTKHTKNKIEDGRWEIFILLKNEAGQVSMRSGIKSQTSHYDPMVTQQFDFSLFPPPLVDEISQSLLAYRSGHPSLALNFLELDRGNFRVLPVFMGGFLVRNDLELVPRIQVHWSSGRFHKKKPLSAEQQHLLQLAVSFYLMMEYGNNFIVEFYGLLSIKTEDFVSKRAYGNKQYDWDLVVREVHRLITEEPECQLSRFSLS